MDWKKEAKSWGLMLSILAFLYFTGLLPVIQGGLQSLLLSTGLIKPKLESVARLDEDFDYSGYFLDFQGNRIALEDYREKTLLINLWASWCGPCRAEMPHLSELYKSLDDRQDIAFLMVGLDQEYAKSKDFIQSKNWSFPAVHASFGLNSSLRHESIPTTLVVTRR
ncbi:TlpA family protein disulfide reductase [Algoriphagus namhaensis]